MPEITYKTSLTDGINSKGKPCKLFQVIASVGDINLVRLLKVNRDRKNKPWGAVEIYSLPALTLPSEEECLGMLGRVTIAVMLAQNWKRDYLGQVKEFDESKEQKINI